MSSYIATLNQLIGEEVRAIPHAVLYGENINNGSCVMGLAKNIQPSPTGRILNVGNCEPTHCGLGFGLMLSGASAVLFVKQLDFMLHGMDHFSSTYNFIRSSVATDSLGSFTIIVVVCDQGHQGPQSNFNALGDLCSAARVCGFTPTSRDEAALILKTQLRSKGFRFIALSQRLFPSECPALPIIKSAPDCSWFQYAEGADVVIVCFNFSLPEGEALRQKLARRGLSASLFSVNHVPDPKWDRIREAVAKAQRVVALDDSKSVYPAGYRLLHEVTREIPSYRKVMVTRGDGIEYGVSPDKFLVDDEAVLAQLGF